jgi:hypothetical protein
MVSFDPAVRWPDRANNQKERTIDKATINQPGLGGAVVRTISSVVGAISLATVR